jgi:glycosyltransferase involved in cell wall biosynthesis
MKIVYFYQYFTVPQGSYSTRVYEFARRWVKAGDSVTVVTSVYDKSGIKPKNFLSRFDVEGIDVRMINIRLSNKHGVIPRLFTFAAYALLACWYALKRRPFVFEVRDLWPEGAIQLGILRHRLAIQLAKFFEKRCYQAASTVIALSDGMADWIKQNYGFQHIEVIPNASDNELVDRVRGFAELPEWARGKQLAMYTGTLGLIDDCGQILDVAQVIQRRAITDLEFVIIGDGKERAQLEEKMDNLKLANVHFLGLMSKEDVMRWLRVACCALFTVKNVPFLATASPNKVFDAFAAGVPVIQATQGWIKDLLTREQCGITVAPNDPEAMADAVLQLAHGNGTRTTMASHARRVAKQSFDRSMLAGKMRQILMQAAEGAL